MLTIRTAQMTALREGVANAFQATLLKRVMASGRVPNDTAAPLVAFTLRFCAEHALGARTAADALLDQLLDSEGLDPRNPLPTAEQILAVIEAKALNDRLSVVRLL
jgi:hypothetical protein